MTFKLFMIYLTILFIALFFVFQIQSNRILRPEFGTTVLLQNILHFLPVIISLSCLYLCVYAFIFKIESGIKKKRPITIIGILGSFWVLAYAVAAPIMGYFSLSNIQKMNYETYKSEILQLEALMPDTTTNFFNKDEAQLHFRKSGEKVEYIDKTGNTIVYVPDQSDENHYMIIQNYHLLKKNIVSYKISIIINTIIILVSTIIFLLYLWRVGDGPR